jgi:gliding motility-associated-like protein
VFSPLDKNGINDYFILASNSTSVEKVAAMQVFNRWGEMVFKREGFTLDREEMGWDGSMNGRALQPGVFTWWADIILKNGERIEMRGDVTIAK